MVCMEDWSSSGLLNVVSFAFVLYAPVINENQLSYGLLYPAIPHLSSSPLVFLKSNTLLFDLLIYTKHQTAIQGTKIY